MENSKLLPLLTYFRKPSRLFYFFIDKEESSADILNPLPYDGFQQDLLPDAFQMNNK